MGPRKLVCTENFIEPCSLLFVLHLYRTEKQKILMATDKGIDYPEGKIKFYGAEQFVMELLFRDNLSARVISEKLLLERGLKISADTIYKFRKDMLRYARDYKLDDNYGERVKKLQVDSTELMYNTLIEIEEKLEQFRDNPKFWQAHSAYLDKALKMLYIVLKKNKEIGPEVEVTKTVNVMNITSAVQGRITELVDYLINSLGIKLEQLPPEYQEMYRKSKGMYAYS